MSLAADHVDVAPKLDQWSSRRDAPTLIDDRPGMGRVDLRRVAEQTVVTRLRSGSPLKLLAPRRRHRSAWIIVSNFGGGLVAGDHIDLSLNMGPGAVAYLGTQASTKVYRGVHGKGARQAMRVTVDHDGLLVVAPDPVTCFKEAVYDQVQRFDLKGSASLVLLDWMTAGRIARGERWAMRRYHCRNDIYLDDDHIYADATLLTPNVGPIDAPFRVGAYNCLATLVVVGDQFEQIARQFVDGVEAMPLGKRLPLISSASAFERGAVLRVAGISTSDVAAFLHDRIGRLANVLGEHPWARKW